MVTLEIRRDDFNLVVRDRFYVKIKLDLDKDPHSICFFISYVGEDGLSTPVSDTPEVIIVPESETVLLVLYISIITTIFKKDDDTSELVKKNVENGISVDDINYPNEFTMWHTSWYKHTYLFLQPFYTYDGAMLRLSYLISELVEDKVIDKETIITDETVRKYPIIMNKSK